MNNKLFCAVAASIDLPIDKNKNLSVIKINSNDNITPDMFSILILDKPAHGLYSEARYVSEEKFDVIAYYDKAINSLQDVNDVLKVFDHLLSFPGVLSHQQISALMKLGILLYNGVQKRIKGASYDLLIDKEHLKSGIKVLRTDTFNIDPLDYVIVGAIESVNLPRNICASFDTKVSMFCKGIILSNGPQVDPGYQGRLLCLLFNTSAKVIEISPATDFEFSSIVFTALSESTDRPYTGKYSRKEHLQDYIGSYADASITDLVKAIPDMRQSIEDLKTSHETLKNKLFTPRAMGIAIIIPIVIAIIAAAFFLGGFNERIGFNERMGKIEKRLEQLEGKGDTNKASGQKEDKSLSKLNSKNIPEDKFINK